MKMASSRAPLIFCCLLLLGFFAAWQEGNIVVKFDLPGLAESMEHSTPLSRNESDNETLRALVNETHTKSTGGQLHQPWNRRPPEMLFYDSSPIVTNLPSPNGKASQPRIALLLSFPNSGTSYTMTNTQTITNRSVGTSYANEAVDGAQPIRSDSPAPYWLNPSLPRPEVVLVKTHCSPAGDLERFRVACHTGWQKNRRRQVYPASIVEKAVHLIRHPADNIFSRMHHTARELNSGHLTPQRAQRFTTDRSGLEHYCRYLHSKFNNFGQGGAWLTERAQAIVAMDRVPCHNEVLHWVRWHDLALKTATEYQWSTHYLYYEDYTEKYNATIEALYDFVGLVPTHPPKPFETGKIYRHLFTNEEMELMTELVQEVASPECWALLRRYFETWQNRTRIENVTLASPIVSSRLR